jgi:hypothetical protein
MLHPEDHGQRGSTRGCSERKQPGCSGWRVRNRIDVLNYGRDRNSAAGKIVNHAHGGDNTVHIHAGGAGALD